MAMRRLGMLNPSKTLFLLCDVQEKFRFMNQFADFAKNVNKLVSFSKIFEIPLIVTEQNSAKLGKTISDLDIEHAKGVFDKTKFSMCIPEVHQLLGDHQYIESIVLFGIESHICVEQTALDLLATDKYSVHIVADCVLSRTLTDRMMALDRMRSLGCFITTYENVIFKLMKDKNHPKFNDVRKLVTETSSDTGLFPKL
ncbi:hypothetical protein ACKWTF_010924 [Chironomus riparius]